MWVLNIFPRLFVFVFTSRTTFLARHGCHPVLSVFHQQGSAQFLSFAGADQLQLSLLKHHFISRINIMDILKREQLRKEGESFYIKVQHKSKFFIDQKSYMNRFFSCLLAEGF